MDYVGRVSLAVSFWKKLKTISFNPKLWRCVVFSYSRIDSNFCCV